MQLCKDIELKNRNNTSERPRSQTEPNRSQTQATIGPNHGHERAVGYNWPDSQRIVYKIEKEQHVRTVPTGKFIVGLFLNYITFKK